jgi:hypothetical protein
MKGFRCLVVAALLRGRAVDGVRWAGATSVAPGQARASVFILIMRPCMGGAVQLPRSVWVVDRRGSAAAMLRGSTGGLQLRKGAIGPLLNMPPSNSSVCGPACRRVAFRASTVRRLAPTHPVATPVQQPAASPCSCNPLSSDRPQSCRGWISRA